MKNTKRVIAACTVAIAIAIPIFQTSPASAAAAYPCDGGAYLPVSSYAQPYRYMPNFVRITSIKNWFNRALSWW